jgi:hypothetical protein
MERHTLMASVLQPKTWQPFLHQLYNLRTIRLVTDGLGNEAREGRRFFEQSYGITYLSSVHPRGRGGHWVSRDIHNCSRYLDLTLFHFMKAFSQLTGPKLREFDFGDISWGYGLHYEPGCSYLEEWRKLLAPVEALSLLFTRAHCAPEMPMNSEHAELSISQNVT